MIRARLLFLDENISIDTTGARVLSVSRLSCYILYTLLVFHSQTNIHLFLFVQQGQLIGITKGQFSVTK